MKSRKKNNRTPAKYARTNTPKFPNAEELLANFEFAQACLAVTIWANPSKSREEIWLQGTGESWKVLTGFPKRLEGMADEIENLNRNFFRIPEACVNPTLVNLLEVPIVLRSYAEALRYRTTRIQKAFPRASRSKQLSRICNLIKETTGKRDEEIAKLLGDAAKAMGYEDMPGFDALQLAQARYRQTKRRKT